MQKLIITLRRADEKESKTVKALVPSSFNTEDVVGPDGFIWSKFLDKKWYADDIKSGRFPISEAALIVRKVKVSK